MSDEGVAVTRAAAVAFAALPVAVWTTDMELQVTSTAGSVPSVFEGRKAGTAGGADYREAVLRAHEDVLSSRSPTTVTVTVDDRIHRVYLAPLTVGRHILGVAGLAVDLSAFEGYVPLTARQLEVLRLLCEGLPTAQIARRLDVTVATVRNHVSAILARLGAHSRIEAVAHAHGCGIL